MCVLWGDMLPDPCKPGALLGSVPGDGARSAPPPGLTAVAMALRPAAWLTGARVHGLA